MQQNRVKKWVILKSYYESQDDNANVNCSGLAYIPRSSNPIILSRHVEYCFIVPSVYDIPADINNIIAMVIAADISNMDEVFGSPCSDLVVSFVLKSRVSSMTLNSKSPF